MLQPLSDFIAILIFCSLILLSFLMLTNPLKVNTKANLWFGVFLVMWSSFWLDETVSVISDMVLNSSAVPAVRFIRSFTPVVFYLSVVFFTNPNYRLRVSGVAMYSLFPVLFLIALIVNGRIIFDMEPVLTGFMLAHSLFYVVASFLKIRKHQKNIQRFSSDTLEINLKWLEYIIILTFAVALLITVFNLVFYGLPLNIYLNATILLIIYFIAYYSLKQKEIFPLNKKHRNEVIAINEAAGQKDGSKRKIISEKQLAALKSELIRVMEKQEPHLESDINLANLSERLQITPHQLSYLINNGFNENFFQFINKYRVEKAKKLLTDDVESAKFSIIGIAFESGFNSKTSFNTTFKKFTGQTPSEFKKTARVYNSEH